MEMEEEVDNWNTVKKNQKPKIPVITINCAWCKKDFGFSAKDQKYFQEKGFEPPKKCKDCRDKKKQQYAAKAAAAGTGAEINI